MRSLAAHINDELLPAFCGLFIDWQGCEVAYGLVNPVAANVYTLHDPYAVKPSPTEVRRIFNEHSAQCERFSAWEARQKQLRSQARERLRSRLAVYTSAKEWRFEGLGPYATIGYIQRFAQIGRRIAELAAKDSPLDGFVDQLVLLSRELGAPAEVERFARGRPLLKRVLAGRRCSHCGEWALSDEPFAYPVGAGGNGYCPDCQATALVWSEYHDGLVVRGNALKIVNSVADWVSNRIDYVCHSAVDEGFCAVSHPMHGTVYVPRVVRDELVNEGVLSSGPTIGEYHSSKAIVSEPLVGKAGLPLLGMELEVEATAVDRTRAASRVLGVMRTVSIDGKKQRYCAAERDGSLDNGFEIVTAPCTLDVHRDKLRELAGVVSGLSSHDTTTCGIHVHVDKAGTTPLQRGKMVQFVNHKSNRKLIEAVARRYEVDARYAAIKHGKNLLSERRDSLSRYEAVNLTNRHTIEFRIFKGSLRYETIMACLEFTRAVWHFTKVAGFNDLYTTQFLNWIEQPENKGDTSFLRQILFERGVLTCKRQPLRETTPGIDGEE